MKRDTVYTLFYLLCGNLDDKLIHKVHNLSHYNLGVFRKKYLNFFGLFNRFYKYNKINYLYF